MLVNVLAETMVKKKMQLQQKRTEEKENLMINYTPWIKIYLKLNHKFLFCETSAFGK